ncbi:MAG: hypothetical protein MUQ56_15395, partial [Thermoleophilia bacterium]|nr:hypothetical protein [Thermoleophilia bacterium]
MSPMVSIIKFKFEGAVPPLSLWGGGEQTPLVKESKRIICVLVSALFAVSLFAGLAYAGKNVDTVEAVEDDEEVVSCETAQWTVLVYMAADNDLSE